MTGPAAAGVADTAGFSISVPDSWFEIPVAPGGRDVAIRELVEDRVRGNQAMWDARQGTIRLLNTQARAAWDSGAAYCAAMAVPTTDGPITASVTVSLVRGPLGATQDGEPTIAILETLTAVPRTDDASPFTVVTTTALPGVGDCARTYGIEDVMVGEGGFVRVVIMQTFVPVPRMNKVFLISASSPVVPLAADLFDLFDAITGTFRIVELDNDPR